MGAGGGAVVEEVAGYGRVYHVGSREDMVLVARGGEGFGVELTHPRVKALWCGRMRSGIRGGSRGTCGWGRLGR